MSVLLYSLVHWEDPLDVSQVGSPVSGGSSSTKEGLVQYRAGNTYLGKELWKSCYMVLRYKWRDFSRISGVTIFNPIVHQIGILENNSA